MLDPSSDPSWLRWLVRQLMRLGPGRATAALTLLVLALSGAVTQVIVSWHGGDRVTAGVLVAGCVLLLTPLLGGVVLTLAYRLGQARARLSVLAIQDELTGVNNRRHFMALAQREWARCRRYQTDGALLLIDADHFKRINDAHGHLCGDLLLREIVGVAQGSLRQADVLARFGGEEFIVLLPHTDPLGALDVAERIREQVSALRLDWQGVRVGTTISVGVASLGAGHASLDALIQEADQALRAAKEAGRNCVRAAPIQPRRSGETTPVISK